MEFPLALYKQPGSDIATDGGRFGYRVAADETELQAFQADGWHLTSPEAKAAFEAAQAAAAAAALAAISNAEAPPTRAELEQKALELGLKFDGRTSDRKLRDMVAAALED
jgi:hypothetical protein